VNIHLLHSGGLEALADVWLRVKEMEIRAIAYITLA